MSEYLVTWQIFVEARSPQEAARVASEAQRNVESMATCFDVRDDAGQTTTVVCPGGEEQLSIPVSPPPRHLTLVKTSRA